MYVRRLDPSVLAFSLSLNRHTLICILFSSLYLLFIIYHKIKGRDSQIKGRVKSLSPKSSGDLDTWTDPHLLPLKREYEILVDKYGCSVEMFTVQDPPSPPSDTFL